MLSNNIRLFFFVCATVVRRRHRMYVEKSVDGADEEKRTSAVDSS